MLDAQTTEKPQNPTSFEIEMRHKDSSIGATTTITESSLDL